MRSLVESKEEKKEKRKREEKKGVRPCINKRAHTFVVVLRSMKCSLPIEKYFHKKSYKRSHHIFIKNFWRLSLLAYILISVGLRYSFFIVISRILSWHEIKCDSRVTDIIYTRMHAHKQITQKHGYSPHGTYICISNVQQQLNQNDRLLVIGPCHVSLLSTFVSAILDFMRLSTIPFIRTCVLRVFCIEEQPNVLCYVCTW